MTAYSSKKHFSRSFSLVELMIVVALIAVITAISVPNIIESRKAANEAAAIQKLKEMHIAQEFYKKNDPNGFYGFIFQLITEDLIEFDTSQGGNPRANGYFYICLPVSDPTNRSYRWLGLAGAIRPGLTGDRLFFINHTGRIEYRSYASTTSAQLDVFSGETLSGFNPIGAN